jgi:tRNA(Arg) A34 adenosine deaminase TadA
MELRNNCQLDLPDWIGPFLAGRQEPLANTGQRMQLAIGLAAENVRQGTGGPFGALVVNEATGEPVSVGVNLVTSSGFSVAHAEIVAVTLAQAATGEWNLSRAGPLQLVTSCEPCAMCFGAVPWSGIKSLVCGAHKKDAEAAGFDEGDKPGKWIRSLQRRGIVVQTGVLRAEAAAVLAAYRAGGGTIYNVDESS